VRPDVAWRHLTTYDWTPTDSRSATTNFQLGTRPRSQDISVAAAVEEFVDAAHSGEAVNRSGRSYRPSALRDLRGILEYHVVADLGHLPLRAVRRAHVQTLVDRLGAEHLSESRIRSVVSALRALYGYAIEKGLAEFNPADALVMPQPGLPVDPRPEPRLDGIWDDPPTWEDRPLRRPTCDEPPRPERREREPSHADRREREHEREPRRSERRERPAYEPVAPVPERLLSLAVRTVFVLFAVVAVVSILESL
jgi:hypothetical protein